MVKTETIRSMLSEGKGRIAVGRAEEVAARIHTNPERASHLMECLWDADPGVVIRAAHALELLTRDGLPAATALLNSWKTSLLGLMAEATENKLRWHLALVVPRITLTRSESARAAAVLQTWLEDQSSSIVKTMSLQGLVDLTRQSPSLLPEVLDTLRIQSRSGTPAMRARGRILLCQLEAGIRPEPSELRTRKSKPHC
jgi:hypothetical protein